MKLNKEKQKMYLNGEVGIINDGTVERLLDITGFKFNGNYKYYTHQHQGHQAKFNEIKYYNISWFYEEDMPKWVKVVKADSFKWYKDKIGEVFEVINEGKFALGDAYYAIKKEGLAIYKSDCTPCDAPNEVSNELPKMGEWWECLKKYCNFNKGVKYECHQEGTLTIEDGRKFNISDVKIMDNFRKVTQLNEVERTPSAYKLNIDIPEWKLKVCDVSTSKGLAGYDFPNGNYILESMLKHIATPIYATHYTLSNGQEIILTDEDIENIKKLG